MIVAADYDVVVIGGGMAGIGVAIGASRCGVRTALVERDDILGGMGTTGLVTNFCTAHWDGERFIIGGVFQEIRQRLIDEGALFVTGGLEPFDPAVFARITRNICENENINVLLNTEVTDVFPTGDRTRFRLSCGTDIVGTTVVDATGDANIAVFLDVPFRQEGRLNDRAVMPLTYCYIIGPIDFEILRREAPELISRDKFSGKEYVHIGNQSCATTAVERARKNNELSIPCCRIASAVSIPGRPEYVCVNFGRVNISDPTDKRELKIATQIGRQQIQEGLSFFRKYIPGFKNADLVEIARRIGVRESRQIIGRYTLTEQDVLGLRQFKDVIAQCHYPIDVHLPNSDRTRMVHIPIGQHYDIPWRTMIPSRGPKNLVVAGRCISGTHEAMSSFRVAPSVMAIGEAAGVTAAQAAMQSLAIPEMNSASVQQRLLETGALLS